MGRISSMNSYLVATGDPSRSALRLFRNSNFHFQSAVALFEFLQACPPIHRQFRVGIRFLPLPMLFDPAA
jgi:hypothetical protein